MRIELKPPGVHGEFGLTNENTAWFSPDKERDNTLAHWAETASRKNRTPKKSAYAIVVNSAFGHGGR
jgi:hypothetical protein